MRMHHYVRGDLCLSGLSSLLHNNNFCPSTLKLDEENLPKKTFNGKINEKPLAFFGRVRFGSDVGNSRGAVLVVGINCGI